MVITPGKRRSKTAMKNDDEGLALLFTIALMITLTMGLNALVQLIL